MFDISTVNKRYFEVKINEVKLDVEPPKIKVLKKIMKLSKVKDEDAIDDLAEAIKLILSKNKSRYEVPDVLIDELDLDEMSMILSEYFEWLSKSKNSPN